MSQVLPELFTVQENARLKGKGWSADKRGGTEIPKLGTEHTEEWAK